MWAQSDLVFWVGLAVVVSFAVMNLLTALALLCAERNRAEVRRRALLGRLPVVEENLSPFLLYVLLRFSYELTTGMGGRGVSKIYWVD